MTLFSSGEVTLTISLSCTCSVSVQPTPQYGADRIGLRLLDSSQLALRAQFVLGGEHQRAGRADADAVAAIDARRIGQRDVVLGRDARVEPASGDGDRERILRVGPAGLDALVAENALA